MMYELNERELEEQVVQDCTELEKHILLAEKRELNFIKDTRQLKVEASNFVKKHQDRNSQVENATVSH